MYRCMYIVYVCVQAMHLSHHGFMNANICLSLQTQLIDLRTTNYQLKEEQQRLVTGVHTCTCTLSEGCQLLVYKLLITQRACSTLQIHVL